MMWLNCESQCLKLVKFFVKSLNKINLIIQIIIIQLFDFSLYSGVWLISIFPYMLQGSVCGTWFLRHL